jgi:hypothetical protein
MRRLRISLGLMAAASATALAMGIAPAHADEDPPPPDPCAPLGCLPDDRVPIDPGPGGGELPPLRPPG